MSTMLPIKAPDYRGRQRQLIRQSAVWTGPWVPSLTWIPRDKWAQKTLLIDGGAGRLRPVVSRGWLRCLGRHIRVLGVGGHWLRWALSTVQGTFHLPVPFKEVLRGGCGDFPKNHGPSQFPAKCQKATRSIAQSLGKVRQRICRGPGLDGCSLAVC